MRSSPGSCSSGLILCLRIEKSNVLEVVVSDVTVVTAPVVAVLMLVLSAVIVTEVEGPEVEGPDVEDPEVEGLEEVVDLLVVIGFVAALWARRGSNVSVAFRMAK